MERVVASVRESTLLSDWVRLDLDSDLAVETRPLVHILTSGAVVGRQAEITPAATSTTHHVCASANVQATSLMSKEKIRVKR